MIAATDRADRPDAVIDQQQIAPLYDRIAPVYNLWAGLTETRARRRALQLAAIADCESVLEVAVGSGLLFEQIVRANPDGRNIGVDLSAGMLARARRRLQRLPPGHHLLKQASAYALPVADDSVDTLINCYMFDLIPYADMDLILDEFRRVLRPGGRLVLVNMTRGERFGSGIYERIYRRAPRLLGGCRGVNLQQRLQQRGFLVERREYCQQCWFPSEIILARN